MAAIRLQTERLELIAASAEALHAAIEGTAALSATLGADGVKTKIAAGWPPEFLDEAALWWTLGQAERNAQLFEGWGMWFVALRTAEDRTSKAVARAAMRMLIGTAGFKGPPEPGGDGSVEVGYGIVREHHRQGYATEAARKLAEWAFSHPEVKKVAAETFPTLAASLGVMRKLGMRFVGAGHEIGAVRYEVARNDWRKGSGK